LLHVSVIVKTNTPHTTYSYFLHVAIDVTEKRRGSVIYNRLDLIDL